jgi:hypothetical protein
VKHLSAALLLLVAVPAAAQDVREAYAAYRAAVAAENWRAAAALIDSETAVQFERVRDAALHADRETLLGGSGWVAVTALALRHYADRKEFDGASGRTVYALARGMSTLTDEPIDGVGEIAMPPDRSRAIARGTIKGEPVSSLVGFVREDGQWRVAWQPMFAAETEHLALTELGAGAEKRQLRVEAIESALFEMLRQRSGRQVSPTIWQAPRPAATRETPDQVAVRSAFQTYRKAVTDRDWKRTAELTDEVTVSKYAEVREAALRASKEELLAEEFWIAGAALALRHASNAAEIGAARGRDFIALANRLNVLETLDAAILDIGAIRIERSGNRAFAPVIVKETETDHLAGFVREDGRWRLGWTPLLQYLTDAVAFGIGVTPWTPPDVRETVFTRDLFAVLRARTGREVATSIWQPLQARTP